MTAMPMMPAMIPPRAKLMRAGQRFANPFAVDDDGGGGHGYADEREERHRRRQAKELAPHLRLLVPRVPGEIRDVQRERGPEAHHRRERGDEHRQERSG